MTDIEWTDATWNPIVGCTRVSAGCVNCYAERFVHRGLAPQHRGLTVMRGGRPGWTGEVRLVADRLVEPLTWRKPRRVFVNSLSDLFHEALAITDVARVFAVMAHAERHTFQVLTKRPKRTRELLSSELFWADVDSESSSICCEHDLAEHERDRVANACMARVLPNVWLGVSVEDQASADERIPHLLACPAAVRWVSYEPALGPVDFTRLDVTRQGPAEALHPHDPIIRLDALRGHVRGPDEMLDARLDWIVVGGESGPGARPFDVAWARSTIAQCRQAGVPVFVKQLGAAPVWSDAPPPPQWTSRKPDRKGGDTGEWPEDLRVREMPAGRTA